VIAGRVRPGLLHEPETMTQTKNRHASPGGSADDPLVVGFLGRSGSGKTTLLERLIGELGERGITVAAVKHTAHGFEADRPGKDSHRLYTAGARVVALVSREQMAVFTRRTATTDSGVALSEALSALPRGLEVVLVEGFSWEFLPRFLVLPEGEDPIPSHLRCGEVIRTIVLPATPKGTRLDVPKGLISELADEVVRRLPRSEG